VHQAVCAWASELARSRPDIFRIGYIGSYSRGDWGVASDLDLILIVERSEQPFWRRALAFDALGLPVPVDMVIYTREEWQAMAARGERFYRTVEQEARWVYDKG